MLLLLEVDLLSVLLASLLGGDDRFLLHRKDLTASKKRNFVGLVSA